VAVYVRGWQLQRAKRGKGSATTDHHPLLQLLA